MLKNKKLIIEEKQEDEVWMKHPLGKYFSNKGRMKHINKTGFERITLGNVTKTGYRKTDVFGKKKYVHRLILEAFTSVKAGENMFVDHIDRDRLNNKLENLRWVTPKENASNRKKPEKFRHCNTCSCQF